MDVEASVYKDENDELKVDPERISVPRGTTAKIVWGINQISLPGWSFNAPVAFAPGNLGPFSDEKIAGPTLEVTDDNNPPYQPAIIKYKLFLRDANGKLQLLDPEIENEDDPVGGG